MRDSALYRGGIFCRGPDDAFSRLFWLQFIFADRSLVPVIAMPELNAECGACPVMPVDDSQSEFVP